MVGPVRARDLRANISDLGYERGVVTTLEALLDEFAAHRQNLREMSIILDNIIDRMQVFVSLGEELQRKVMEVSKLTKDDPTA